VRPVEDDTALVEAARECAEVVRRTGGGSRQGRDEQQSDNRDATREGCHPDAIGPTPPAVEQLDPSRAPAR
jgi:hypothetical protein